MAECPSKGNLAERRWCQSSTELVQVGTEKDVVPVPLALAARPLAGRCFCSGQQEALEAGLLVFLGVAPLIRLPEVVLPAELLATGHWGRRWCWLRGWRRLCLWRRLRLWGRLRHRCWRWVRGRRGWTFAEVFQPSAIHRGFEVGEAPTASGIHAREVDAKPDDKALPTGLGVAAPVAAARTYLPQVLAVAQASAVS